MTHQNEKINPLATRPIGKLMAGFALPAIVSSLINSIYNIVDQIFIGQSIGSLGNAATNVAFPLVTLTAAITMLLGVGGASVFSLRLGEGKKEEAGRAVGNSLMASLVSGVVLSVAVLIFLDPILVLFGARGQVLEYARPYMGITTLGLTFSIITSTGSQLIRADGNPKYSMISAMSGAIIKIVLDPIFIFALNMGMRGAAYATLLGQIPSAILVVVYFRHFRSVRLVRAFFWPQLTTLRRIIDLGAAAFFNQIAVTIVQVVLNNTLGHYGELSQYGRDIPLAVVGIVSKVNSVFMSVIYGIAQSCQPIMGFNYGAKNYARVRLAYRKAAVIVTAISSAATVCFQLFPRQIISIFGQGSELYFQFGTLYFRIYLLCTFINGIQILSSNFFSSIGKARKGILISMCRQILFLLPLILLLPYHFGIDGVLFAGPVADGATGAVSLLLVAKEMRSMRIKEEKNCATPTKTACEV